MGTWGTGAFDNDGALDWVYDLEEAKEPVRFLGEALQAGLNEEYLESTEAESALAAAEVVAALMGRPAAELPQSVTDWLSKNSALKLPPELAQQAAAAIDRVRTPPSEMMELWEESGEMDGWLTGLGQLRDRLKS
ncbi:DUF4259 domain-containing protein [bacterium]|nr:DUF4259 domain-containing protein [bacterium]